MDEQMSLFSFADAPAENSLRVLKCHYEDAYDSNKDALFSGYDDIKVLTYSYGLGFIKEILKKFKTAEIIIGSEKQARYDILEVMANQQDEAAPFLAFQGGVMRYIRRNENLINRIKNDEVSIWLAKDILAHEKMYILTAENGNTRVIYGSANFSWSAFAGEGQRESILVFDNDQGAYNEALEEYEMIRDFCTQEVEKDSLYYTTDGKTKNDEREIEELPIVKNAVVNQSGIILNAADISKEDIEFAVDVSSFSRKFAEMMPKTKANSGKIKIESKKINTLVRSFRKEIREEKERRKENPQFKIDYYNIKASLNDEEFNLSPDPEFVKKDIGFLFNFFNGYDGFIGNAEVARESNFMLMNYMFMSPFIGRVRNIAAKHRYPMTYYPLFAILSGPKSSGKSSFVKTMLKFMYVKKMPVFSSDDWVKTTIKGLMNHVSEMPLLIDDVSRDRFKSNADAIIKEDEYINRDGLISIPTFILTSNDIHTSIDPSLKKRALYMTSNLTLDDVTAAHMSKPVEDSIANITGAFYCEYLKRAIPKVTEMIELMEDSASEEEWHPDLFRLSSETILEIIAEFSEVPKYMRALSFEDYFGNNTIMRKDIREKVLIDFEHNKAAFEINRKKNELIYTPGERGYEAQRVSDALPEILEPKVIANRILMPLDKAEAFFGIRFKKGLFR